MLVPDPFGQSTLESGLSERKTCVGDRIRFPKPRPNDTSPVVDLRPLKPLGEVRKLADMYLAVDHQHRGVGSLEGEFHSLECSWWEKVLPVFRPVGEDCLRYLPAEFGDG